MKKNLGKIRMDFGEINPQPLIESSKEYMQQISL